MAERLLDEFLDFLKPFLVGSKELTKLIRLRFNQCDAKFKNSVDFSRLIHSCRANIKKNKERHFVYIRDFVSELKAYSKKHSKHKDEKNRKRKNESESADGPTKKPKNSENDNQSADKTDPVSQSDAVITAENTISDFPGDPEVSSTWSPSVSPKYRSKTEEDITISKSCCKSFQLDDFKSETSSELSPKQSAPEFNNEKSGIFEKEEKICSAEINIKSDSKDCEAVGSSISHIISPASSKDCENIKSPCSELIADSSNFLQSQNTHENSQDEKKTSSKGGYSESDKMQVDKDSAEIDQVPDIDKNVLEAPSDKDRSESLQDQIDTTKTEEDRNICEEEKMMDKTSHEGVTHSNTVRKRLSLTKMSKEDYLTKDKENENISMSESTDNISVDEENELSVKHQEQIPQKEHSLSKEMKPQCVTEDIQDSSTNLEEEKDVYLGTQEKNIFKNEISKTNDCLIEPEISDNVDKGEENSITENAKQEQVLQGLNLVPRRVALQSAKCDTIDSPSSPAHFAFTQNNAATTSTSKETQSKKKSRNESTPFLGEKKSAANEKHIRRLEKLLANLRNEIEKAKEKELSLDDLEDDDSSYIYEDKLQKKFVKVWDKLCELKGRRKTTGRPTEQRFSYEGTRYPEVNKKIESFINKTRQFPDILDIIKVIEKTNKRKSLNMSNTEIEILAAEAFDDVGKKLQQRRKEDFMSTFGCSLTDKVSKDSDPALKDPLLKQKLDKNKEEAKVKLEQVFSKYSAEQDKREKISRSAEDTGDQSEEEKMEKPSSPVNNDDEDEDEIEAPEEEVEVPELDAALNDDLNDKDLEDEEPNEEEDRDKGDDVINLSTDEEEDEAQSEEDENLPKTFGSVIERMKTEGRFVSESPSPKSTHGPMDEDNEPKSGNSVSEKTKSEDHYVSETSSPKSSYISAEDKTLLNKSEEQISEESSSPKSAFDITEDENLPKTFGSVIERMKTEGRFVSESPSPKSTHGPMDEEYQPKSGNSVSEKTKSEDQASSPKSSYISAEDKTLLNKSEEQIFEESSSPKSAFDITEDENLPKTFNSVIEKIKSDGCSIRERSSPRVPLELVDDEKSNDSSGIYFDIAEDSEAGTGNPFELLAPLPKDSRSLSSDSDIEEIEGPVLNTIKSPARHVPTWKLSIRTPQKSLIRKALGLKSPTSASKQTPMAVKNKPIDFELNSSKSKSPSPEPDLIDSRKDLMGTRPSSTEPISEPKVDSSLSPTAKTDLPDSNMEITLSGRQETSTAASSTLNEHKLPLPDKEAFHSEGRSSTPESISDTIDHAADITGSKQDCSVMPLSDIEMAKSITEAVMSSLPMMDLLSKSKRNVSNPLTSLPHSNNAGRNTVKGTSSNVREPFVKDNRPITNVPKTGINVGRLSSGKSHTVVPRLVAHSDTAGYFGTKPISNAERSLLKVSRPITNTGRSPQVSRPVPNTERARPLSNTERARPISNTERARPVSNTEKVHRQVVRTSSPHNIVRQSSVTNPLRSSKDIQTLDRGQRSSGFTQHSSRSPRTISNRTELNASQTRSNVDRSLLKASRTISNASRTEFNASRTISNTSSPSHVQRTSANNSRSSTPSQPYSSVEKPGKKYHTSVTNPTKNSPRNVDVKRTVSNPLNRPTMDYLSKKSPSRVETVTNPGSKYHPKHSGNAAQSVKRPRSPVEVNRNAATSHPSKRLRDDAYPMKRSSSPGDIDRNPKRVGHPSQSSKYSQQESVKNKSASPYRISSKTVAAINEPTISSSTGDQCLSDDDIIVLD